MQPARTQLMTAAFLVAVFVFAMVPVDSTSDFWWHLSSGRAIVEAKALPSADPFTFAEVTIDDRVMMILRGYWLLQAIYYLIYSVFGLWGISALMAASATALAYIIYRAGRMNGMGQGAAMLLCAPTLYMFSFHSEPRPQIFSFTLAATTIYLLELWRTGHRKALWALPPMAVLWANIHPGFIIMYPILLAYAGAALLRAVFKKDTDGLAHLMTASALAVLCTGINPMGFGAVTVGAGSLLESHNTMVVEYFNPWKAAGLIGMGFLLGQVVQLAITGAAIGFSIRRARLEHIFLFAGMTIMAMSAARFSMFFVTASAMAAAPYLGGQLKPLLRKAVWAALGVFMAWCLVYAGKNSALRNGPFLAGPISPDAVEYVAKAMLPPRIFNSYEWGGYMGWRLWPIYQVYIDSRMLSFDQYSKYIGALDKDGTAEFNRYGINTVVLNHFDPLQRAFRIIMFNMLVDNHWVIAYYDNKAVIFVRRSAAPELTGINKSEFMDYLEAELKAWAQSEPGNPEPYLVHASLKSFRGHMPESRALVEEALRIDPGNPKAIKMLNRR